MMVELAARHSFASYQALPLRKGKGGEFARQFPVRSNSSLLSSNKVSLGPFTKFGKTAGSEEIERGGSGNLSSAIRSSVCRYKPSFVSLASRPAALLDHTFAMTGGIHPTSRLSWGGGRKLCFELNYNPIFGVGIVSDSFKVCSSLALTG